MEIRRSFAQKDQRADEDFMQYFGALESFRNQSHQKESRTEKRYEILHCFIEGVRNQNLRESLSALYANKNYLGHLPTGEEIRFANQQYLRTRGSNRDRVQQSQNNPNCQPLQPVQQGTGFSTQRTATAYNQPNTHPADPTTYAKRKATRNSSGTTECR